MLKKIALSLALPLALISGPVSAQNLTQEQVEDIVKDVIQKNPDIVMEALIQYQQTQADTERQMGLETVQALLVDPSVPKIGNATASPSGVVFLDYNCPHCRNTHVEIEAWLKANPDKSIAILDFPILGPGSVLSARAALAAHAEGRYPEALTALMNAPGQNTEQTLEKTLVSAGFDVAALATHMSDEDITQKLQANAVLAKQLGITGTPGAVFGDQIVSGGFTQADLDTWIK